MSSTDDARLLADTSGLENAPLAAVWAEGLL